MKINKSLQTIAIVFLFNINMSSSSAENSSVRADSDSASLSSSPVSIADHQKNNPWFTTAQSALNRRGVLIGKHDDTHEAKNIILFIGDGMGVSTVTAARILEGQLKGMLGEENNLSFDLFPHTGMAKTYNVDAQTPDSAGTMSAIISGVKTDARVLGVDEDAVHGDCRTQAGNELVSALELAEIAGKSTGIITTTRITHATPAATYAKSVSRNWEDISDMPVEAIDAGCIDIAIQLVEFESVMKSRYPTAKNINGIDVVMGGGWRHFLPNDDLFEQPDSDEIMQGDRSDGRNLIAEWQLRYPKGVYVSNQLGFDSIDTKSTARVFGLFNKSHMRYEVDRQKTPTGEPSLTEMTLKAINILDNNKQGYFLMVESGRIDHGHHAGNAYKALHETIEFSNAIKAAVDAVNMKDTLIIVTADHSHVFTIAGYPRRGNAILGKVVSVHSDEPVVANDGLPYTTLAYANGRGFRGDKHEGRADLTDIDTQAADFYQEALVPLGSETHAGEDVTIYGQGAGAFLIGGTNEQNIIFHIMNRAANLENKANKALRNE